VHALYKRKEGESFLNPRSPLVESCWVSLKELKASLSHQTCIQKEIYLFTLDECELASAEARGALICQSVRPILHTAAAMSTTSTSALLPHQDVLGKGVEVPLVQLVPDIAMAQYQKVAFSKIEMGTMIGQGTTAVSLLRRLLPLCVP